MKGRKGISVYKKLGSILPTHLINIWREYSWQPIQPLAHPGFFLFPPEAGKEDQLNILITSHEWRLFSIDKGPPRLKKELYAPSVRWAEV